MQIKPILAAFALMIAAALCESHPSWAATEYDRQAMLRQQRLGQSSLRFDYAKPQYFSRKSKSKPKCVQLGQARCMVRPDAHKKPDKFTSPLVTQSPLNPYLRGTYKYGVMKASEYLD